VLFELFFVLRVNYLLTGHLNENVVNDWYLTTNMLELPKLGR